MARTHAQPPPAPDAASGGVPSGAPAWVTVELFAETIRVWQPYYDQSLAPDEALAIILSVGQLFNALAGDSRRETVHRPSAGQ